MLGKLLRGGGGENPAEKGMEILEANRELWRSLPLPVQEEYRLTAPELVGLLEAEEVGPTELSKIDVDPRLLQDQMDQLARFREQSVEGFSPEDRLAMEDMLTQAGAVGKSQRAAIEQEMARRGMSSSGGALAAKLMGTQGTANTARRDALELLKQSRQKKDQSAMNAANLAGQMQNMQYNRDAMAAQAQDAINRANAAARQSTSASNLAARQAIANQRANVRNVNVQLPNQFRQQNFQNQVTRLQGMTGAGNNLAQMYGSQPQTPSGLQAGLAGAAQMGAATGGNPWAMAAGGAMGLFAEDGGIAKGKSYEQGGIVEKDESKWYDPMFDDKVDAEKRKKSISKGLGGLAEMLMADQEGIDIPELAQVNPEVVNVMEPQRAEFQNPFENYQAPAMAEGGVADVETILQNAHERMAIDDMMNKVNGIQNMEDGGTYQAENGELMFTSDDEGDIVGGDSFERDRVDARLNSGEAVLNVAQQQRLMDLLRGEISLDEMPDEDIVEGVPADYQDELTSEIDSGESDQDVQAKGFAALLDMLGRKK